jgi:acyl-CoA synthetase (AMP-forming)/AMP-acid ligase II
MPAHWAAELSGALGCEVAHGYGLTEGGGFVTIQPPQEHSRKPGSVGRAVAPFEPVRVLVPGTDRDCKSGEVGELLIKGPSCTAGYVGDEEETAATLLDGWVRTGDLARVDTDGDVWISGRLKDQINRGGLKIGAREVEAVIETLDGVQGVGVVGVPDPVLEERVAAVIEAEPGAITAEDVQAACAKVLADHKVPERILIVQEMPRTSLGKANKPAMRDLLARTMPVESA